MAVPVLVVAGVAGAALVPSDRSGGSEALVTAATGPEVAPQPPAEASALLRATIPTAPSAPVPALPVPTIAPVPPPTTPVTEAPATTVAPSATAPTMTLISQYPVAVSLKLNGTTYALAPGQEIAGVTVSPQTDGNDIVYLFRTDIPDCGLGDAGGYFPGGGSFRVTIVVGVGACAPSGELGPDMKVSRA